jgi:hypothetical protein
VGKILTLWPDYENPLFCPILHLLVYGCYLLKIKDGHLCPAKEELLNPPIDGVYKTWMSYETFLIKIRNICHIGDFPGIEIFKLVFVIECIK